MKNRPKEPATPVERHETVRREIMDILEERLVTAKDISGNVGIPMKEVYDHLDHIRKTLNMKSHRLSVTPAECRKCGFVFRKRERLKKPGKCPVCRSESIEEPLFSIRTTGKGPEEGAMNPLSTEG
jgi:predicted Zn-ribbon and HTH transcriptional regulator